MEPLESRQFDLLKYDHNSGTVHFLYMHMFVCVNSGERESFALSQDTTSNVAEERSKGMKSNDDHILLNPDLRFGVGCAHLTKFHKFEWSGTAVGLIMSHVEISTIIAATLVHNTIMFREVSLSIYHIPCKTCK